MAHLNEDAPLSHGSGHSLTVTNSPAPTVTWKQNVLRGQALREQQVHLSAGQHTLTIRALDAHIVFDQWQLKKTNC